MQITFERATPDDAEALVKIQVAAFHDDSRIHPDAIFGGPPGYDSVTAAVQKMAACGYYKILADGKLVGGLAMCHEAGRHYHLDVIYIDPAYHNHGIGTQAMAFIEEAFPVQRLTLNTPSWATRNHHFYEKLGYERVGFQPFGSIMLIVYEKRIQRA